MAGTVRSNLPSRRLRQLLSGEVSIGPTVKLDSETPPKVKAFIDKVIQCPLQDIAIPLSGFSWEYNKGNFHHWRPLFLHLDTYFKTYLSTRKDLLLTDNIIEDDSPFPKQSVLQILRVMRIILENCHNKGSFSGLEHFKLLLASTDPEILIATLETLSTLVKINPSKLHANGKLIGCGSINSCLLSLAQGWGSIEEGLGLYSSVVLNEKTQDSSLSLFPSDIPSDNGNSQNRVGSTLYFELHGTHTIHIPDIHTWKEDDLSIMKLLIEKYNVPVDHRFLLLTRVRYAHAFRSPSICRMYSKICLLAFIVLVQSSDSHDELMSFFANEPEYTNELIKLVKSEETISPTIRTLAMHALGSQLAAYSSSHERARTLNGSNIAGGNRVILFNVLQRAISSLNNSSDPPSIAFIEALLQFYLLQVISTSSPGSVIQGSEMVSTFLSLLGDMDPLHMHLVCLSVKTLQKLMDYSNSAVTLFRDLGGVDLLTNRLQIEVGRMIDSNHSPTRDDSLMSIGECSDTCEDLVSLQKRLIRALLKALGCSTYAPANTHQSENDVSLPATLVMIFKNVDKFGGDVYSSTVTLMCELIHKDPTGYPALDELGLPNAFLSSVTAGVLPSSKSLTCVPSGLAAICLNAKGLDAVKETSALRFLIDAFTLKKYALPMNEGIVTLANAIEELMRHVTSLKPTGVDLIIEIINKIATIEDSKSESSSQLGKANGSNVMDMDTEESEKGVSDEQFIQLSIFHVMVLLHRILENAESCRLFVESSGIEALLKLLLRPSITQSSEGMSIALHSTMVFKSFTQHHSAPLARAFCSSLRDYIKTTLAGFKDVSGSFLLDPKSSPDSRVFPSLFLVEFLLFLAASKDNKWVTALLQEFGNGSKDVLEDIGRIHREILWQIASFEDAKFEAMDENANANANADVSQPSETNEQRLDSFRQFLDPLIRRSMSGWSSESQFLDLINLYRDLTHSSGPKQRSHPTGSLNMMQSLSLHITHLFQELGKAMLLPSRRRDDTVTVTPSSKSVASMIASITLDHMNFEGHVKSVASTSAKCRYLGKVVEFIYGILLDKPDSCNPVLLNCLYGLGVIQSVLTTFKDTTELLFRAPMETDEGVSKPTDTEETIHGSLVNYGRLMDHLVTSSFILSPSTTHLLTQPLVNGDTDILFPKDPKVLVKVLQSMILKGVLPLWIHPHFSDCNDDFVSAVISIICHVFSGVEVKNVGSRPSVPPNETTISMIVEMGFSRNRAEEALRQVGSNSVELATEWLFSHPEIVQEEDDELAQALAMSLGNSASVANETNQQIEEETVHLPAVDDLLSTCKKLLETKDSLSFSVRDLLLMISSHEDNHYRSNVITFIVDHVKLCSGNDAMLSSLFHVLALLLNKDKDLQEVASKSGLVKVASDLLSNWNSGTHENETLQVPKWVTAAFLAVDRLAQVDEKINNDISELLKKDDVGNQTSVVIDIEEQKRLVEISCGCLKNHLPSETIQSVLQLCSTLTRTHSVAVTFLNAGGLPLLLSLPSGSLFVGFDNIAGSIIRHILEDSQTLQQAMESEIKQSVVTASSRQANGRLTPRNFLMNLTSVISRDPVIFMKAAKSVCQIEMVGERPYVILLKDHEKDKVKEKGKSKVHHKPPQSFVNVIELLLVSVITFIPPVKDDDDSALTDMDIDVALNKGKGKEIASTSENSSQEHFASMAKVVLVLKLLKEMLLMYSSSVHVLLRKDTEVRVFHHILHQFLPHLKKEKKTDVDWRHKLAVKATQFLISSCVRSTEARKRIFMEINNVVADFVNSSEAHRSPGQHIQPFVDLLHDVLAARSPTGSLISGKASVAFIDVGLVRSLTQALKVLDLDHAESLKVATMVVKVLEVVTKEHVHAAEGNSGKGDNATKPPDHIENEQTANENIASSGPMEHIVTDDMEHDQDLDGSFAPRNEDDYMHGTSEDNTLARENGFDSLGIRFEIQDDNQESSEDDDDDMSGDGEDEDDEVDDDDEEDEDEGNDIEEDEEVHRLPHLDTDQEDHGHEIDEDDFDEDMIDEEEEEDEDDEDDDDDGVILGLGEELNGMNVLDQIEEFGRDHGFSSGALEVMPVEVFGSRRQGRTTSIYNLLERTRDTSAPSQHPLLLEPSSSRDRNAARNPESTPSRLESIFRSLRNGRHGHARRISIWADNQQIGGTNASGIPSGLEDLLVSQLRPPTQEKVSDNDTTPEVQSNEPEPITENNGITDSIPPEATPTVDESQRDTCPSVESASQENSVTEVSENPSQETEQGQDSQIDPAFLDALSDGLRAEVISGQQGPVAQPVNTEPQNEGDNNDNNDEIDPEFLAALPPDIRAEVLAQQQAQGAQRSQELEGQGQPLEMDTVSIIATFPSEIREEVLLTSSDAVLSSLSPALMAEANMLRERFASRYSRTLLSMFPRSRRGESSRRGEATGSNGVVTRRSTGGQPIETDGAPLVDMEDLKAMIRLLRVVQPIYKPQLQRLLLNLCAHADTRSDVVQILMDFLVLDSRNPSSNPDASEPSFRLYSCQSHLMYSRPQSFDGVPPLVSRRVLETLTFLARNHKYVAKLLLQFRIQGSKSQSLDHAHGKAVMIVEDDEKEGFLAINLLLTLLKQPLYMRSITHLEQLLSLLGVIIDNAESKKESDPKPKASKDDDDDASKPSSSGANQEKESHDILLNLPQQELRVLCSLLACESLSDNVYGLVADILKKLVAITPHHSHLFITELAGSMKSLTPLAINELHVFSEIESTSKSDGTTILRVIQALSSLVSSLNQEKEAVETKQTTTLSLLSDINTALEPLWVELSACISKVETYSDSTPDESASLTSKPSTALPPGTQNILPYIESFFVTCEQLHFGPPEAVMAGGGSDDVSTSGKLDEKNTAFVKFSEKHRKLINGFIRQNPGLLEKSFSAILRVPRFIDFDNKRSYFRSKIKHRHDDDDDDHRHGSLRISVRRAYILEDSYSQLRMRSTRDLKGRLTVNFQGEEGVDAGGLTREWYQLLSRVIFDKGALLFTSVGNESTFQPNPNSVYQTEHLSYFKFIGRVVGKAVYDGQLLDVHFTRSFYKHMLGVKVTYHDIEAIDPAYFKNLKWMLENDISDMLDLTFSIDADEETHILYEKGQVTDYELIPGGRNIRVTEENKKEYVDLIAEHRLTTAIRPQINAFLEGFNELVPRDFISIFHDKELELLISGLPDIDLDDMRANTEYSGYSGASPVIQWFWEVAQGLSKEDKARLLQFVTGTSKVPLEGFSALQGISGSQKFQIHKAYGSSDRLPSAHTCFNQLDLPEYPSKQHLEERLLLAIHEANEGFGFG